MDENIKVLIQQLSSEDAKVRLDAVLALGNVGDISAVPALVERLKDEYGPARFNAALALGIIAQKNPGNEDVVKAVVPALIQVLKDEYEGVREAAACALEVAINRSSVEQLDQLKAQIIEAVEKAENTPGYKQMKYAAAGVLVTISKRRNQLLTVEVNLDPAMVVRRPKPPRGRMYRMPAFAGVS